jgi:hypothetical protein
MIRYDETPIRQRSYGACPERSRREHIIHNHDEWNNIHLYIESNPLNWATDNENLSIAKI